jgi:hypothetical protein
VEDAADYPVAQLGDSVRKVLDGEAEWQQSGILDLETVVENREADRRTALGVVRVYYGIDHGRTYRLRRHTAAVDPAHRADLGSVPGMFLHEGDGFLDTTHGDGADLGPIEDPALVDAREAVSLDPGIREVPLALLAKEDHTAHGRRLAPLVSRHQTQGLQIAAVKLADGSERLGSGSEVEDFRVETPHRLLVDTLSTRETPQLFDQFGVCAAVGRAHADGDSGGGSLPDQRCGRLGLG